MFILSRTIGEVFLIEDVVCTLVSVDPRYAEVALRKHSGGKSVTVTLPHHEPVDICYNAQLVFVECLGTRARLGIDAPDEIGVRRR
jgi:sRNA-binding carbon storage regulator CsrA